uniref:UDP-glycosyltransferase 83A1-like n=1 Tax=Erigeron canadensis TaxID=72917 RepID=UPI001CB97EDC|nr:UDP-glycosyltransferase 83A1-like [Erigeron canadensis]
MGKSHVLIIPYPAQGHVMPMIELARYLVQQGVKVTFVNTEVTQKAVTSNWQNTDGFDDLMMVSIPDGLEPWEDRTDLCKLTISILETMPGKLEELIEKINKEDSNKLNCVIADGGMGWAIKVSKKMGIISALFQPASAASLVPALCAQRLIEEGFISNNGIPLKNETIQLSETMPPIKPQNLPWACFKDSATIEAIFKVVSEVIEVSKMTEWYICNSTIELEPAAFSMFPQLMPIGPLLASNRLADQEGHFWQEDPTCLTWLDQQPECSVIYIAFGSFTILNQTQFEELTLGLELSNRPFLWVLRPGMTKETYPDGFMERVKSRGKIVSWAPQQKVLAHPSVACFMSHCGWNSTIEGVTNGLPFLCWPYFADQIQNETYICDIWKTGLGFNKDESAIITRDEIKSKVDKLLSDKMFRSNALDIKEKVTNSIKKGGCSNTNLTNFTEWIQKEATHDSTDQPDSM